MDTQKGVAENIPPFVLPAYVRRVAPEMDAGGDPYEKAIGERIRICRGATPRKDFGDALGLHINTIGKLERGETLPDALLMVRIAHFGKRTVEWLATGVVPDDGSLGVPLATKGLQHGKYIYVPHFDIQASAGNGNLFDQVERVKTMRPFDQSYIQGELGISHDEIALVTVIGDSMEPRLSSGDTVLIDRRRGLDAFTDGIHVVRLDDALLVKQVQRLPGRVFRISSLNADYQPFDIKATDEAERDFAIIGRVRWGGVTFK
jgi:phage repressor protein C with HTH and peptisase S24 domain